jgi:hypothetical protein
VHAHTCASTGQSIGSLLKRPQRHSSCRAPGWPAAAVLAAMCRFRATPARALRGEPKLARRDGSTLLKRRVAALPSTSRWRPSVHVPPIWTIRALLNGLCAAQQLALTGAHRTTDQTRTNKLAVPKAHTFTEAKRHWTHGAPEHGCIEPLSKWMQAWFTGDSTYSGCKVVMHEFFIICDGDEAKWLALVGEDDSWGNVQRKVKAARQASERETKRGPRSRSRSKKQPDQI